jgi:hypothetical protein
MARKADVDMQEGPLRGFKYFKRLLPVLEKLHDHACARDKAHNRTLHFDHYIALILLYFFNPLVESLRGIQRASQLKQVQRRLGCSRASLGSLSEAARVFDAHLLVGIIGELSEGLQPVRSDVRFDQIQRVLTLVDGTLLSALPQIVEAMWRDDAHRAFKLHTHFELLKAVPVRMDLTDGNMDERRVLEACLQPDRVYVMDRGYLEFALFQRILGAGSSFVCRLRDNTVFEVIEERELSHKALDAGVVRDAVVRFSGKGSIEAGLTRPLRIVEVACKPHRKPSGKTGRGGPEQGDTILIGTDILDAPAELISLIYKHRWAIETFFCFFKHVLGCRHLLSHCPNGIEIQTYVAIIFCLLIALWTGAKPTRHTYEMTCYYLMGWADEEEFLAHIEKLQAQS